MINTTTLTKAVKLAKKGMSSTEISETLDINVHSLRMLFTDLRNRGCDIPRHRKSKKRKLLEEVIKKI